MSCRPVVLSWRESFLYLVLSFWSITVYCSFWCIYVFKVQSSLCPCPFYDVATTMADIDQATSMYKQLENAWDSGTVGAVGQLLPQMKIMLLNLSFLPSSTQSGTLDPRELVLARNTLEIGALWSIQNHDIPSFQRYVAQLKCYYFDYGILLPDSAYKYQILGLNLLSLLAQNRLAEFHSEMELLSVKEQKNIYIKYPIRLEQFLMEGSFHKVFLDKGNIPAENYSYFIDILINTMRDEIASCVEKAYSQVG